MSAVPEVDPKADSMQGPTKGGSSSAPSGHESQVKSAISRSTRTGTTSTHMTGEDAGFPKMGDCSDD